MASINATGSVSLVTLVSGGTGFSTAPTVSFVGGGGIGAAATAAVSTVVTGITLTSGGSGYAVPTECRGAAVPNQNLCTEVSMVPAAAGAASFPASWTGAFGGSYDILDGRIGGITNPASIGPAMWQVGTEGGFLPNVAFIQNRPVGWDHNTRSITIGNVLEKALWLGPAERADVVVDFSTVPAGSTLILYNDAPAPVPAFDLRNDYYTNDPDNTATGGASTTLPGYGPNTRTLMQIKVNSTLGVAPAYNIAALQSALPAAYGQSQDKPIIPEYRYNTAFGASYPVDPYIRIQDIYANFTPANSTTSVSLQLTPKSIVEDFDMDYGRMNAMLGQELLLRNPNLTLAQTTIPAYDVDPPTEIIQNSVAAAPIGTMADGTQVWKITHNGVDTHAIHWHMFNVQLIDRVGWDGSIRPPNDNEIGWKDTVILNPLEDAFVALRPIKPNIPWDLPNSIRPLDVTAPLGVAMPNQFNNQDPFGNPATVINHEVNYGWEYLWHCHILGHEENIMMRPIAFVVTPRVPLSLVATTSNGNALLTWTDNSTDETNWNIQRANATTGPWTTIAMPASITGPAKGVLATYTDPTVTLGTTYYYRVNATNVVGDTTKYAAPTVGYPNMTADSGSSNTAAITPSGNLTAFVRGADNAVWTQTRTGAVWSGWQNLGGIFTSDVSATSSGSTMTIFARDANNAIWTNNWNGAAWSGWQSLAGTVGMISDPDSVTSASGTYLFARGANGAIWTQNRNGAVWSGWQSLGGIFNSDVSSTSSGSNIAIFARGIDGSVWTDNWNGIAWSGWAGLGGIVASDVSSTSSGSNITIFVRGTDNSIWTQKSNGTVWGGWQGLGGITTASPDSTSVLSNTYLFAHGADNSVWTQSWNGTAWSGWQGLGGIIQGNPEAING
ncbi:Laccase [uncultured archaeon]|nr:Laccase [uncultured archaeon]